MPLQKEVTTDTISAVPLQFWKDDLGGAWVLTNSLANPCMKGQGLPLLSSLAEGCRALTGLRLLLKLFLLFSVLFLSPDPDATP